MTGGYGFTSLPSEVAFKGEVPLEKIGGKSIPLYRCPEGKTLVIDHVAFHLSRKGTVRVTLQAGDMDLDCFYVSGPPTPPTERSRLGGAWKLYGGSELSIRFEQSKLKAKATFSIFGKVGLIGVVESAAQPELRLRINGKMISVDGQPVALDLTPEAEAEAIDYLMALISHAPGWVSGPEIGRGIRWDRVLRRLPNAIQELIETDRRKGNRLRPAAWRK